MNDNKIKIKIKIERKKNLQMNAIVNNCFNST